VARGARSAGTHVPAHDNSHSGEKYWFCFERDGGRLHEPQVCAALAELVSGNEVSQSLGCFFEALVFFASSAVRHKSAAVSCTFGFADWSAPVCIGHEIRTACEALIQEELIERGERWGRLKARGQKGSKSLEARPTGILKNTVCHATRRCSGHRPYLHAPAIQGQATR